MSKIVRITCAIVDKTHLTMYKEDGDTIIINQGDVRMKRIVDSIGPQLLASGYADVDLSGPEVPNSYKDFEEKSSGVVSFFRIAKEKLKSFFRADDLVAEIVEPVQLGQVPNAAQSKALADFQEVMQHATPVTAKDFDEDDVAKQGVVSDEKGISSCFEEADVSTSKDTIIAVVGNKIVPGVEKIKSQLAHAAKNNSTAAVEAFMKRLADMERTHSVEDLLKFMERGDLPIADDGSIIIYKILKTKGDDSSTFYDCHSGNVPQKVGSYVCMDESLVDPVRNNECSNGLHVARRGYLRSFSGNIMVLAKVAPEDVITVPSYDANKMRVCGYHIIMQLPMKLANLLRSNRPMTSEPEGQTLLAAAIAGKHIGRMEEVRIRGQMGRDVLVTPLEGAEPAPSVALENLLDTTKVKAAVALEADKGIKEVAPDIDPVEVAKQVKAVSEKVVKVAPQKPKAKLQEKLVEGSPRERIQQYLSIGVTTREQALQIVSIKRAAKKSWDILGVNEKLVAKITKLAGN